MLQFNSKSLLGCSFTSYDMTLEILEKKNKKKPLTYSF